LKLKWVGHGEFSYVTVRCA